VIPRQVAHYHANYKYLKSVINADLSNQKPQMWVKCQWLCGKFSFRTDSRQALGSQPMNLQEILATMIDRDTREWR
jgi:hypothetical protein